MSLEPKVGEIFELDGKKYKCVNVYYYDCSKCSIQSGSKNCKKLKCSLLEREDNNRVIYKLITDELG